MDLGARRASTVPAALPQWEGDEGGKEGLEPEISPEECRASIYVPWGYYSRDGKILVSGHGDESKQAEFRSHVCLLAASPSLPEAGRDGRYSKDASQPHSQLRAGLCGVSGSQIGLWEANNPPRVPVENLTRCKSPSKTPCQSSSITSELV